MMDYDLTRKPVPHQQPAPEREPIAWYTLLRGSHALVEWGKRPDTNMEWQPLYAEPATAPVQDADGLIERLRKTGSQVFGVRDDGTPGVVWLPDEECQEAADALQAAQAEIAQEKEWSAHLLKSAVDAKTLRRAADARVVELEKDAERLDWMAKHLLRPESSIRLADGTFKSCNAWAIASANDDLREAIDAARAQVKLP